MSRRQNPQARHRQAPAKHSKTAEKIKINSDLGELSGLARGKSGYLIKKQLVSWES
jgi:hypothetical protein